LKSFTAVALEGFPLIKPGDDIPEIIVEVAAKNDVQIEEGDIIVVCQKILSKAEGRIVSLRNIKSSIKAREIAEKTGKSSKFVELVLSETNTIIKANSEALLVKDKRDLICINAGIDKSNVEGANNFSLLPENPDISAKKCRQRIEELTGKKVAVVISDTYSRPFRRGQVNFAIGIAGISPFKDYRGKEDLFGNTLKVKNVAVVDEIAAAAELLMGQAKEAKPVVIFKGLKNLVHLSEGSSIKELYISKNEDLFKNTL